MLGLASGAVVGLAAEGYVVAYPDEADRTIVATSIGGNPGLAALFGEPRALETIAGFTEWRVLGVMPLVAAVWGVLAGTAALRGEEDAGRWDMLLSGPISRREATIGALLGLAQTAAVLALTTIAGSLALGVRTLGVAGSLWIAAGLLIAPIVFLAVAAVAAQVGGSRPQALRMAAGILGAAYLLRVVSTAIEDLDALSWLSPLGWVDRAAPLTEPNAAPLLVAATVTVLLAAAATDLSARRDVGAGLWPEHGSGRSSVRTLTGPTGLALRLSRPGALAWLAGLGVLGGVLGLVAPTASEALADAEPTLGGSLGEVDLSRPDAEGTTAFLGASFLVVGLLLALLAAGHAALAREEEASGRLETLLAAQVRREHWFTGRVLVAVGVLLAGAATTIIATWLGGVAAGEPQPVADLAAAGVNTLPAALVVLGIGMAALGWVPRLTALVSYVYVAAAFLLEIVGSVLNLPGALLGFSVFHHVPLVPASQAEPTTSAVLVLVALIGTVAGLLGVRSRDVTTG